MLGFKFKSCGVWKNVEMLFRPRATKKSKTVNWAGSVGRDYMEDLE